MTSKTQIPEGWRLVRLGEVVAINRIQWNQLSDASIMYLDLTSIVAPGTLSGPKKIAAAEAPSRARRRVVSGDILVSTVRPNLRGFARVHDACENLVASTGFAVLTPAAGVNGSYVYQHVMTQQFAGYLEKATTGQAYPAVRPADVANYELSIPPLPEQRAIAAVLDSIDDAIDRTDAVIKATEQLRDSLLHELLTRGVPCWHSEWKDVPGLGTIPEDWEVVRLGEVVTVASGQSDPKAAKFQGSLFVAPDDIESGTGRLINRRTVAEAHAISGKYRFDKFEVLYSKIRPYLMKVYRPHESGLCSADIYPLRPKSMLEAAYLALALLSLPFTDYTRTCSDRTGIPKINRIDLFKYRLTLPSLPEQRTIAAMLDGVAGAIARARGERDRFRSLKEATADALLTGRVRVGGS